MSAKPMTKMSFSTRNHNVTLAVAFIISCVVMLLYFLNITHDKLENSKTALYTLDEKYTSLLRQYNSLTEYKDRLENSFMSLKNKKSFTDSETDSLKSELAVLKSSHKGEIQRLHDELDACRRREEMAMVHQSQKDEALSPSSLLSQSPSLPISPVDDVNNAAGKPIKANDSTGNKGESIGLKVFHSILGIQQGKGVFDKEKGTSVVLGPAQPSVDPNQDPAGNIFV